MPKFNLDKALAVLETAGKVSMFGWSDKLALGGLRSIFRNIDKDKTYQFIDQNLSMWQDWSEERWDILRRVSQWVKLDELLTMENVMALLSKERPDLYTLFSFHPQGKDWLKRQLEELRQKVVQTS